MLTLANKDELRALISSDALLHKLFTLLYRVYGGALLSWPVAADDVGWKLEAMRCLDAVTWAF